MTNVHDARTQAASLPTATKLGERYTLRDLNVIKDCKDRGVPARILAESLHRSLYGIRSVTRSVDARLETAPAYRTHAELPFDRGFTTLEAMGF